VDTQEVRARCFSAYKVGEKLCGWNTTEIVVAEAEFLLREFPDIYTDEGAAMLEAGEDDVLFQHEWEYLVDYITELMKERGLDEKPIYCEVVNFGWRGIGGEKVFSAEDGEEFLSKILPKANNTFYIYKYGGDGLAINNYHHDSPWGKEWYYATPIQNEATIEVEPEVARQLTAWMMQGMKKDEPIEGKEVDEILFQCFAEFDMDWEFGVLVINGESGPYIREVWLHRGQLELEDEWRGNPIGEYFELEVDDGFTLLAKIEARELEQIEKGE